MSRAFALAVSAARWRRLAMYETGETRADYERMSRRREAQCTAVLKRAARLGEG